MLTIHSDRWLSGSLIFAFDMIHYAILTSRREQMSKIQDSCGQSILDPCALHLTGPDAFGFLQAQLTLDLRTLKPQMLQATAWCNANGRVAIVLLVAVSQDGYLIVVPRGLAEQTLRRILLFRIGHNIDVQNLAIEYCQPTVENALLLTHSPQRALRIAPAELVNKSLAAPVGSLLDDIRHGLPWIVAATSDRFLPQMLGLDQLGGLSYRKGCYPGQEVIARVHFRGRVTRTLRRFHCQAVSALPPGLEFGNENDRAMVLYSAAAGPEQVFGLAVVPAGLDAGALPRLDAADFGWLDNQPAALYQEQ